MTQGLHHELSQGLSPCGGRRWHLGLGPRQPFLASAVIHALAYRLKRRGLRDLISAGLCPAPQQSQHGSETAGQSVSPLRHEIDQREQVVRARDVSEAGAHFDLSISSQSHFQIKISGTQIPSCRPDPDPLSACPSAISDWCCTRPDRLPASLPVSTARRRRDKPLAENWSELIRSVRPATVESLFLCECLTREHRAPVVHAAAA
jgi:hypothetical protein